MSEFRQDLVSGDWIIIASERAKRPHDFLPKRKARISAPLVGCPFEDLKASGNWPPILAYPNEENSDAHPDVTSGQASPRSKTDALGRLSDRIVGSPERRRWRMVVIPNKFPAVTHHTAKCALTRHDGPYKSVSGIGHHELLVGRDHNKNFGALTPTEALEVFKMFQERFRNFGADACIDYVSTFFNWGPGAGASLFHPHYQILALPIVPPNVAHSLHGSKRYFETHKACAHCVIIKKEMKDRTRIIAENKYAVLAAPYASHEPFEMRVYPKKHLPYFERTKDADLRGVVAMLQIAIEHMKKYLNDPDFNFFIHTSPVKGQSSYAHYHWHIEVAPKMNTLGGFELSTGVIINSIEPTVAARMLRGRKITDNFKFRKSDIKSNVKPK